MSDSVSIVTVRGVQGRRIRGPDIYCHLVTGRRHEKEAISGKQFKRWGQMAAREKKNASGRERERKRKGRQRQGDVMSEKTAEQREETARKEVGK